MARRDLLVSLSQMRDHAREAIAFARGKQRKHLDTDRLLSLALIRLIEIVGEAAGRVEIPDRERYPRIPWTQIVGLRNRLIHGYDAIDLDILWEVLTNDLPELATELDRILDTAEDDGRQ